MSSGRGSTTRRGSAGSKKDDSIKGRSSAYRASSSYRGKDFGNKEPQWSTKVEGIKLPKKLSDELTTAAKAMFFSLDRDNSGSIDADELGVMLRSLGQNPTDKELQDLIDQVDGGPGGEKDGQIQLREFLQLYADTVNADGDKANKIEKVDAINVFQCFGGVPTDELSHVTGESITATLAADFGLECNLEETFGMNCEKLSKEDVAQMLNIDLTPK